tara:strand:+ start:521 stop:676 length:156 start_codon:yes stop_codon:yes gene_type:complete
MDTLEYWENIRNQRLEDISLEVLRDEDPELIRLLKASLHTALEKIQELTDV